MQAVFDALSWPIAVLDQEGRIVDASASWRNLAAQHLPIGVIGEIGESYLDVCARRAGEIPGATALGAGVARVLSGSHATFERVCWQLKDYGRCAYRIRIKRLRHCQPRRFLLSHEEVTELLAGRELARRASKRVEEIRAEEREKLAVELHDSVGQNLVSISLGLTRLRMTTPQTDGVTEVMSDMSDNVRDAHAQIRTLSYLLHPPWLEGNESLEDAVREFAEGFARRSGLRADVRMRGPACDLGRARALALFRILQEGLVNVHRHAQASTVFVVLDNRVTEVTLQVKDDGRGFASPGGSAAPPGAGLTGIRARAKRLGGEATIESSPTGTALTVRLPSSRQMSKTPARPSERAA